MREPVKLAIQHYINYIECEDWESLREHIDNWSIFAGVMKVLLLADIKVEPLRQLRTDKAYQIVDCLYEIIVPSWDYGIFASNVRDALNSDGDDILEDIAAVADFIGLDVYRIKDTKVFPLDYALVCPDSSLEQFLDFEYMKSGHQDMSYDIMDYEEYTK